MFKRYGSWLLLLCALMLLCAISLREPARQLRPNAIQSAYNAETQHYITIDDQIYLDINRADAHDLSHLPGVGETLAERIIQYRNAHGPFASIDGLMAVDGIGEGKMSGIRPYIAVSP